MLATKYPNLIHCKVEESGSMGWLQKESWAKYNEFFSSCISFRSFHFEKQKLFPKNVPMELFVYLHSACEISKDHKRWLIDRVRMRAACMQCNFSLFGKRYAALHKDHKDYKDLNIPGFKASQIWQSSAAHLERMCELLGRLNTCRGQMDTTQYK